MKVFISYDPLLERIEDIFTTEEKVQAYCNKRNKEEDRNTVNYCYKFTYEERELID